MTNKELERIYKEWRQLNEEIGANSDCGEQVVREDFSNYAELKKEISFEEMLELERNFEKIDEIKKEVHFYKGKHYFEKVEKINGEYIFFEHEEENGETPNIAYPISELNNQVRDYKKRGYKIKIFN